MSTLLTTPSPSLEEIQRAAFFVFYKEMNEVLAELEAYWLPKDQQFDAHTGRKTAPTTLEKIQPASFHEGHKPSLISGQPESYPNLAVFVMRADPSSESNSLDQMDSYSNLLLIEVMVKSPGDEDSINRRCQRTTEAAVICLSRNQTLGGAVTGLESSPRVTISDVFAMRSVGTQGGYQQRWIWQGAAIECRIRKDVVAPGLLGSIFKNAPTDDYSSSIDQG